MATVIANPNPVTYADWAKTRDPDGKTAAIVEILEQMNPITKDVFLREGNMTEGHQTTIRAGQPRGTWVAYNEGSLPIKSASRQTFDKPGRLQAYFEIDKALVELEDDKAAFMLSESTSILAGLGLDYAETLIYGNSLMEPKKFMGIIPRYNDVAAESAANIFNGKVDGGDATGHSILGVTWGANQTMCFFPRGSMAGLQMEDLGQVTGFDDNGGRFEIYRQRYEQRVGLTVRDWRANYRIAQLQPAELLADGVDLVKLLILAEHQIRGFQGGSRVIYCNQLVYQSLDVLANTKSNVALSMREWGTEEVVHFRNTPIRQLDALNPLEAAVPGLPALI